MNKLLQRQVQKVFGTTENFPQKYNELFNLISESYENKDNDRKMLERVLEMTSEEMIKLNEKIRAEARDALKLVDNRLKHATSAVNVGIWEFDFVNDKVIWDETTFKLYGLDYVDKIDEVEAWKKHVAPEHQKMAEHAMKDAISGKKEFDIEYKVIWPDNSVHYLRTKGVTQKDETGRVVNMLGTKWDVSEKWRAQLNIKREKELADSVINSLPVIFFLFNKEGKFLRWNKNLMQVTGYSEEEMAKIHPLDFFHDDEKEKMQNEIKMVLTYGQSDSEANILTKSKKRIPYYFNSITINYEGQECVIGTGTNITDRKRMEENLKAKNKDLEEFAHIVSHNLRAPIAKIQGLTSLVNTEEVVIKDNMDLLEYIKDEVTNLDKIIKEMNSIIREKEYVNFKTSYPGIKTQTKQIKTIFLIDDDPVVNIISTKIIEKAKFAEKIEVYTNAGNALEDLDKKFLTDKKELPEVVFLDINMPGKNGWEFLDEFEKLCEDIKKNCKVFMLTSSIDPNDVKKSQTYETVKDFIVKPLTKEKLAKLNI
ncbi:MAG: PAS domain-containing protein [Bacteroidetes bacterium]|nr:PAS domain-containing protein [Bacteroidota bacterium]